MSKLRLATLSANSLENLDYVNGKFKLHSHLNITVCFSQRSIINTFFKEVPLSFGKPNSALQTSLIPQGKKMFFNMKLSEIFTRTVVADWFHH